MEKRVSVDKIIKDFYLIKLNEFPNAFIERPSINRAGLLLGGNFKRETLTKNIVGWGTNESEFLLSLSEEKRKKALKTVIGALPPLLLLSIGFSANLYQEVLQIAEKYKVQVVKSQEHLSTLIANIGSYLTEYFAKTVSVHGCAVLVNGVGVMIIGPSGAGKSEAVLELIQEGHTFVTDDTVVISRLGNRFIGKPATITQDFLEVRGIGLIDIRHTYGSSMIRAKLDIDLVLELVPDNENIIFDRLGKWDLEYNILDGAIQKIQIPVKQGRTISSLVVAAVNAYLVRKDGLDPLQKIQERILKENE
ncbi:HPr(Ser) kinase/phosphatase [Mesomycoplasma lagogenitalium]|uniref:HPr(Ser) kinase/phosphatase n=1 Tax=Mesomycoplasma lagogenitalium TaxID=171286 RepID=A0ABY8LX13_9BACT|nr:HPr(Ser) kinase/phosphatase [Mesomycoplasma lagogenitalium]WGI36858.1 HPr(Ser) kinase/phosphatase [Mesomycoplasma lagogenitalium]